MKHHILNITIVLLLLLLGWLLFGRHPAEMPPQPEAHTTTQPHGGDFSLHYDGGDFALESLRGKVVLLYFGYTMCPDVCPTSLAMMQGALTQMNGDELGQVVGLFVSVDPKRDTPARLEEYTHYFHEQIIGVSGSTEEIASASALYGASYRVVESDSAAGYLVDHSSMTYVIDKQGVLREILPHGTPPAAILAAVRPLFSPP